MSQITATESDKTIQPNSTCCRVDKQSIAKMSNDLDLDPSINANKALNSPEEKTIATVSSSDQSNAVSSHNPAVTTTDNDDSPRRSFSELRAMFSSGQANQAQRPTSPGLDLTPVKEQQTPKVVNHEVGQLTEANNNGYRGNSVLENSLQSVTSISNSNNSLDNSQVNKAKAISFEIDFDDCVTRDCVTRDSTDSLASSRSRNSNNGHNVGSTTEQKSSHSTTAIEGVKKSYSFEISFDDDAQKTSCIPPHRRTKAHDSKFKTSSPIPPRENFAEENDSKYKTSHPKEQQSVSFSPRENTIEGHTSKFKSSSPKENISGSSIDVLKSNSLDSSRSTASETISSKAFPSSLSFEVIFDNGEDSLIENDATSASPRRGNTSDKNLSSNAKSSSLSFEINFDDCNRGGSSPRREKPVLSRKTSKTKVSPFASHDLDDRPEKESRATTRSTSSTATERTPVTLSIEPSPSTNLSSSTITTPSPPLATATTRITTSHKRTVSDPIHPNQNHGNSPLQECRNAPHYQSLDTFPEKECSEVNQDVSTSSISFDISFDDDDSSSRKTKLAPKHIRLKMSKRTSEKRTAMKEDVLKKDNTRSVSGKSESKSEAGKTVHDKESALSLTAKSDATKRDTYTLDEVSQTLQEASLKGETLEQALDNLAHCHDQLERSSETDQQTSSDEANTAVSKRGTYSLDEVSNCLVDAANSGFTVTQALESLALSQEDYANYLNDDGNLKRRTNILNERRIEEYGKRLDNETRANTQSKVVQASSKDYDKEMDSDISPKRRTWNLHERRNKNYATDSRNETNLKRGTVHDKRQDNTSLTHEEAAKLETQGFDDTETRNTKDVDNDVAIKRGTYDLDDVSRKLDSKKDGGNSLEQALEQLLGEVESAVHSLDTTPTNTSTINRNTYDLEDVSNAVQNFADHGIPVEESLDKISAHVSNKDGLQQNKQSRLENRANTVSDSKPSGKRGTWNLDDFEDGSLGEVPVRDHNVSASPPRDNNASTSQQKAVDKRGTWNLDDFDNRSLAEMPIIDNRNTSDAKALEKRGTWNLDDAESLEVLKISDSGINSGDNSEKRGTYNLDDVAKQLDSVSGGQSVVDTLSSIADNTANEPAARNTYTLDEVAQSLEVAKTKGIPVVQALSNLSNSGDVSSTGSRGTYPLDEVAESIESARKKGLPIVMALENLISHDNGHRKEPESVAIHRRQGKLTNRKTYALASPLETIGEDNQLKLFDGTSRKFVTVVDPMSRFYVEPQCEEEENPSGEHVVKTLDLLTSACEALLKSRNKEAEEHSQETLNNSDSMQAASETEAQKSKDLTTNVGRSHEVGRVESTPVQPTPPPAPPRKRIPRAIRKGYSKSESNLNTSPTRDEQNRQTYSLDSVSNSVETAKAKGIPVIAALDKLTNSLAQFSATGAKALKNGKKPVKKPDRPSIRKRQAARERAGVMSEVPEQAERPKGAVFPISYPPAMRNSYSLDDVASAFEMAYKTGASFEDFLYNNTDKSETPTARSTETLALQGHDQQKAVKTYPTTSADSVTLNSSSSEGHLTTKTKTSAKTSNAASTDSVALHSSSSEGQLNTKRNNSAKINTATSTDSATLHSSSSEDLLGSQPRKNSSSSEGGLSYSSSASSDLSAARDSSLEDLTGEGSFRKPKKRSTGPFQLRRKRRGPPASTTNVSISEDKSFKSTSSRDSSNFSSSRGSSLSGSATSLQKRGTYDLKQVSKELDTLKQQGLPVAKALDKLGSSDNIATNQQQDETANEEHSSPQGVNSATKNNSKTTKPQNPVSESPKRNTYVLEDDINNSKGKANTTTDTGTRNTFTLDHVQDSIENGHECGVPVVDVLDKLSSKETPKQSELKKHIKAKFKTFTKPQTKSSNKDEFFVEFFPPKSEQKSPRQKLENGEAKEVPKDGEKQSLSLQNVKSKMTSKATSPRGKDEFFIEFYPSKSESVSSRSDPENSVEQVCKQSTPAQHSNLDKDNDTSIDKTKKDPNTNSLSQPRKTSKASVQVSYADQLSEHREADEKRDLNSTEKTGECSSENTSARSGRASGSRPRWQHTGSYIKALNSFEQMIDTEEESTDKPAIGDSGESFVPANEPSISTSNLLDLLRNSDYANVLEAHDTKSLEHLPKCDQVRHTSDEVAETAESENRAESNATAITTTKSNSPTNQHAECNLKAGMYSAGNDLGTESGSSDKAEACLLAHKQNLETTQGLNPPEIDIAESDYSGETYDTMETESSPRSRWRPSGSVLGQILNLMDDAEERGLSIADALEQAAELSEREGEIEESKDEDAEQDTGTPQHLALLSLHFEEKRRQIEAEKHRSHEQWEQERRRLDETAFWYTIGRGQSGARDVGNARTEREKAVDCPSLPTPPIGRSTPFECLSPLQTKPSYQSSTIERSQSPGSHGQPTMGHGYHPGTAQRPGYHSSGFQSPVLHPGFDEGQVASRAGYQVSPHTGFQFPAHAQSPGMHQTGFGEGQVASRAGYQTSTHVPPHSPITHQAGFGGGEVAIPNYQTSTQFSAHSPLVHQTGFGEGGMVMNQPHRQGQEEFETRQFRFSEYANQDRAQNNDKVPISPSPNGPMKSPVRKCWDVTPPVDATVFTEPTEERGPEEQVDVNQYDDPLDDKQQNKKGVALFIGEEAEKPKEGLTPEQQRKRDRFLKNRLKKQEEDKLRRDAEHEQKRLRDQKQKELEEQKRLEEEQRRVEQQHKQQQRRLKPPGSTGSSGESIQNHDDHSAFNEFSGPRCYVKPSGKSNRKLIINAISHVCLSGTVNKDNKDKCLQAIAESPGFHFIVLFKDGLKFRGLYMMNPETEQAYKIYGIGPKVIVSKMVDCVYKYSSGGKEFSKIPSKSLSISVDGVAILKSFWQSNKPVVASKTQSNLKRPPRPPQR